MKPIAQFPLLRLALLGVPLLFANPHTLAAVDPAAPEADTVEDAQQPKPKAELDEAKKLELRAKREEAAKRAEAAKAEAAKRAEDAKAKAENEKTDTAEDKTEKTDRKGNRKQAREERKSNNRKTDNNTDKAAVDKNKSEEKKAVEPPTKTDRRDRRANPATPATPAIPAIPGTPATRATPAVPANPTERTETPPAAPKSPPETPPTPATEPERQAETKVQEATREVERDLSERKTKISNKDEAQAVIEQVLGTESRISRAEILREERVRPRIDATDRQRRGDERVVEISPVQRREAVEYFQQRLRGERIDDRPPAMLLRSDSRHDTRVERTEIVRPRYLNEGRRYVHYDSRASIPAILLAAEALNRVKIMPAREMAPVLYERRESSLPQAELPPQNYRDENAFVVSYPVNEKSMITSEDILFQQGSTQFADPYSYEVVSALGDAMKNLPDEERFAIEGHASSEGSYEDNMVLSQQRAERIVREMVRRGVSPQRLIPVGYGESEARHTADTAEAQRKQDRRVVVFRLNDEPVASR